MANISVTIDASKFNKWLSVMPEKANRAISNIIQKGAEWVERESKIKTPVDSGRLRASIHAEVRPMVAVISPNVNYAIYVHEGTRYMRPRPFMGWGLDVAKNQFPSIVENELKKMLS